MIESLKLWKCGDIVGKKARLAAVIAAVMTLIVTVVRIVLTPQMLDLRTGEFQLSAVIIGLMAATDIVVIVLSYLDKIPALPSIEGRPLQATAWMMMALGAVLAITVLYDAFVWRQTGITPPPNTQITGTADKLTLWGTLIFGLLAGVYGILQGWNWISIRGFIPGKFRFLPLALPLWLSRYVVSYASAVSVTETFYDYAMLIVSLLFAMSLARYLSGLTTYRSPALLWQALLTVLCGVSGPVTRFIMYLMGETDAYQASALASFPDLMMALFAGCVAVALVLGQRPVDPGDVQAAGDEPLPETQSLLEELAPEQAPENAE